MQRVNIVVGRFQPFTKGHYSCVSAAKRVNGLPTIICMINVPEDKVDKRHPFPSDMLINLYGSLFKNDNDIAGVVPVQSADIVKIGQTLRELGFEIASWTCGTDRYLDYSEKAAKYHDRAGLTDDFEVIKVSRDLEKDVSATKVRNCLLNDDIDGFMSMIPDGPNKDKLYNDLKAQIDSVFKFEGIKRYINKLLNEKYNK